MADYASLKVPELKKLLQEKTLPATGNKADLIARLQENDKKASEPKQAAEDEIDYSDDDSVKIKTSSKQAVIPSTSTAPTDTATPNAEPTGAAPASTVPSSTGSAEHEKADSVPAATATDKPNADSAPELPKEDFALNMPSTSGEEEARKRAERAKRFGLLEEDDNKRLAERAKRFGIDNSTLASGLDAALPEGSRKRGRDRGDRTDGRDNHDGRISKRKFTDRNGAGAGTGTGGRRGGRGGRNQPQGSRYGGQGGGQNGKKTSSVFNDPSEKVKAEARAKRFAAS